MYKLQQTRRFQKDFNKLEKNIQHRVIEKLAVLARGKWQSLDMKKLKGAEFAYRLRSGTYRVLFEKRQSKLVIIFVAVKHRKDIYR